MDSKLMISWTATLSQAGLLLTGAQTCLRIIRNGSTGEVALFPFLACCLSSVLWTKYGLLQEDFPITLISCAGMISQSIYILIYYTNVNARDKKNISVKLLLAFLTVTSILSYIKYYVEDVETASMHLGFVCSGFSVAVYGSPLVSLATVIRKKSTECLTFSLCIANFIVSLQWLMYGQIVQDNFIKIPNGVGVLLSTIQVSLFICYPSKPQKTITYTPGTKPSKLEI
ncbi:sugar transporter SWEET1-like [Actinia tenebrosa]|uniref:Sugar transporter SWEET n=1 Tax=Actinia tenebrosa TaxID=6105 RepID=A0A6P8HFG7_ACTTE|nr:sugar transporter SWEET1-like [Actinia tenebrosa]